MITRQHNWLGQQRLDVPHLKAIESGGANDFDELGGLFAGSKPVVVSGFELTVSVGDQATDSVLGVGGSKIIHYGATESGSLFNVAAGTPDEVLTTTNAKVIGSFTASSTNYVGIDIVRVADNSTSDTVQFLVPATNQERPAVVPLARTTDYRIYISTTKFTSTPNVCPIAIVTTGPTNVVTSVQDARWSMFRLPSGGDTPSTAYAHTWSSNDVLGDSNITNLKDWLNAAMTRMWEIGGGEAWCSRTADRNVRMVSSTVFSSSGEPFEIDAGHLHWQGLKFIFDNTTGSVNEIEDQTTDNPGQTDLADGECIYVDLDRTQDLTGGSALVAQKAPLKTLGGSLVPGQRFVIAWRSGAKYFVRDMITALGTSWTLATTDAVGAIRTSIDPLGGWAITDPIAAGLALGDGAYTATCAGVSHNDDLGATTLTGSGDILIGRGDTAGDEDVIVTPGYGYGMTLNTEHTAGEAFTISNEEDSDSEAKAVDIKTEITGSALATRLALSLNGDIQFFPAVFDPTIEGTESRLYVRSYPNWHPPVDAAASYNIENVIIGVNTITNGSDGELTAIDDVPVANINSVLVRITPEEGTPEVTGAGIYTITDVGSPTTPWVMTRISTLMTNAQFGNGVAVKVVSGTSYINTFWKIDSVRQIDKENDSMIWTFTSNLTTQQLCMKWPDTRVTVICESEPTEYEPGD